jgi:hypothetical protein
MLTKHTPSSANPPTPQIIAAISDQFSKSIWNKTAMVFSHGHLSMPPPGTSYEGFADRRTGLLRGAVRRPLFRPALPAVIVENSETCKVGGGLVACGRWTVSRGTAVAADFKHKGLSTTPSRPSQVDADRCRVLPDGTRWVDGLLASLTDLALKGQPYVWRPRMARRPNNSLKWLIPVVAYGQVGGRREGGGGVRPYLDSSSGSSVQAPANPAATPHPIQSSPPPSTHHHRHPTTTNHHPSVHGVEAGPRADAD